VRPEERKFLKEPDEFVVWTARATTWIGQNRGLMTAVGGGMAAVAMVAAVLGWQASSRTEAASNAFRLARTQFAAGEYAQASASFETLAREFPGTAFGRLAILYRGHSLLRQNESKGAADAYQEFLAHSLDANYVRQLALANLGQAQELLGEAAEARASLARASDIPGPYRIEALLAYARLSEGAGDAAAALAAYRKVLAENPDAETRTFVERRLPDEAPVPNVR
jgi:tetratricopeptide (TPR) repeat protein